MKTPEIKLRHTQALICALLAGSLAPPLHALEITTTGMVGYGTPLDKGHSILQFGYNPFPLNDYGIVAIKNGLIDGGTGNYSIFLTDGSSYNQVYSPNPYTLAALAINNVNTLTYQIGPVPYTNNKVNYQTFSLSTPYTASSYSAASQPSAYWASKIDTNTAGQGVVLAQSTDHTSQWQVSRLNGDGTSTGLAIDPSYLANTSINPKILENGDIYVGLTNYSNQSGEIWRFAAGQTATHTVAYSTILTQAAMGMWDVNDHGDLVVSLSTQNDSLLKIIAADGTTQVIDGTQLQSGGSNSIDRVVYLGAFIDNSGMVGAVRTYRLSGVAHSEVLYALPGAAAERVLSTEDTYSGRPIVGITPTSDMNAFGQMTVYLTLDRSSPTAAGEYGEDTVIRLNPPGADPTNPLLPDPCSIGNGWCYDVSLDGRSLHRRPIYFDPALAVGYEYRAESNAFTGVEIPYAYGDGRFDLYLWDEASKKYFDSGYDVLSGIFFDFVDQLGLTQGLARFAVYGIDSPVDPADPLGFVTGLTFFDASNARFSMTAVLAAATESIPEPHALALFALGFVFASWRSHRAKCAPLRLRPSYFLQLGGQQKRQFIFSPALGSVINCLNKRGLVSHSDSEAA